MEVNKVAEEQEIWDEEEEVAKSVEEAKKMVVSTSESISLVRKPVKECS